MWFFKLSKGIEIYKSHIWIVKEWVLIILLTIFKYLSHMDIPDYDDHSSDEEKLKPNKGPGKG